VSIGKKKRTTTRKNHPTRHCIILGFVLFLFRAILSFDVGAEMPRLLTVVIIPTPAKVLRPEGSTSWNATANLCIRSQSWSWAPLPIFGIVALV